MLRPVADPHPVIDRNAFERRAHAHHVVQRPGTNRGARSPMSASLRRMAIAKSWSSRC
jgi:hypothetical protein